MISYVRTKESRANGEWIIKTSSANVYIMIPVFRENGEQIVSVLPGSPSGKPKKTLTLVHDKNCYNMHLISFKLWSSFVEFKQYLDKFKNGEKLCWSHSY